MGKHSTQGSGSFFGKKRPKSTSHGRVKSVRALGAGSARVPGKRRAVGDQLTDPRERRSGALESAPARLKAERERRRRRAKKAGLIAGSIVGVLVLVSAIAAFAYMRSVESGFQDGLDDGALSGVLAKAPPQKPYTVLLLGDDHRSWETKYRTDTIILARVDPKNKQVSMISIPRDTRVEIPGYGVGKINSAYFYGGPELAIETVRNFTGVEINHYMQVSFGGFWKVVDALGGVWVDVPVAIDDKKAASHSEGRRASRIDQGYQLLDGEHALTFVRSRNFADGDFSRMKNQQLFFKALADQIASRQNLAKLPRVISAVQPHIKTDMTLMEMVKTGQALKGAGSGGVNTVSVPGEWKSPYVWPDEAKLTEIIGKFNAGVSFDATSTPAAADGSAKKPADISVAVRNGAGIAGSAKQAASVLKAHAFQVGEVGNANQFVYEETLVVYKTDRSSAEQVALALPPGAKVVESRGMYSYAEEVLVVVGKNWDISKLPVTPVTTR